MSVIAVHAIITPKPEHVNDVQTEMLNMVRASRQEEGNLRYDLLREEKDGTVRFHVQERYRDREATQAHRDSAHYQAYRAKAGEWFASAPEVTVLEEIDVA
ncbi:antibiotic biosynthesis monooxygenase [Deinococcus arenae]|uniref:Antibiotic biosynthesis monooxygenase n=1 Tax=Deinococcus arenae TaxID=1452751 RepID=A0A8H9GLP9_9DEIO|nr:MULTISPECIES: putative quinol monooxygenase [Deinococcus]AWT35673.1 antibiotic biosynthesis monooxygenase [Deinococcus actinosclerus]GGM32836.1 antibiotic biosynthesis monooxygenase [Deinococcus arenae]